MDDSVHTATSEPALAESEMDNDQPNLAPEVAAEETTSAPILVHREEEAAASDTGLPLRVIEALLFAADTPLSAGRLVELVGAGTPARMSQAIEALNAEYEKWGVAFSVLEIANGFQLMTQPEYRPWLNKLNRQRSETRLTDATLEALAIVAYRQPIIRADVESIRGVACGEVLNRLREMGLVRIVGRAEVVGRPMMYGTTKRFLDIFGLASIDDLPPMETLKLRQALKAPEQPVAEQVAVAGA